MCAEKFSDLFAFMQFCVFRKVIKQISRFYFPSKAFLRRFTVMVEVGADNDLRETNENSRKVFIVKLFGFL